MVEAVEQTRLALATHPAPRALLPALIGHYRSAVNEGCAPALHGMIQGAIGKMSNSDMKESHRRLFKFFLVTFDLRKEQLQQPNGHDIDAAEVL